MFAILLHENMNPFYQTIASFPTVIYTGILLLCLMYWIIAMLGFVDIDFLDMDLDGDIDAGDIADAAEAQNALAGLLLKFGLYGVPLTIILTIMSLIAWIICYYASYYSSLGSLSWLIKLPIGLVVFVVATYVSALITGQILKPVRTFFNKLEVDETKHILGQVVIVRSAIVNKDRGEGFMSDGGAGLLLNIRATGDEEFKKGDEVVVFEQLGDTSTFRVIAKSEFKG